MTAVVSLSMVRSVPPLAILSAALICAEGGFPIVGDSGCAPGAGGPWRAWWCPNADSAGDDDGPRRRSSPLRLPARTSECAIAEPENALCWLLECAEGRAELAELKELFISRREAGADPVERDEGVKCERMECSEPCSDMMVPKPWTNYIERDEMYGT